MVEFSIGDEVRICRNYAFRDCRTPSYTHGEKGIVIDVDDFFIFVQLDDAKKYPVVYRYYREEIVHI